MISSQTFRTLLRWTVKWNIGLLALWTLFIPGRLSISPNDGTAAARPMIAPLQFGGDDSLFSPLPINFSAYPPDTAAALNNLRDQLEGLLTGGAMNRAFPSVKVVFFNPDNSVKTIYAKNADASITPASEEKLFTSSTTLWALGSKYSFTTKIDVPVTTKVVAGRLLGNVYLRPTGDPTFKTTDFDAIARQLRAKGITTIAGDIVSDLTAEGALTPEAQKYFDSLNEEALPAEGQDENILPILNEKAGPAEGSSVDETTPADASAAASDPPDEMTEAGVLSLSPNFAIDRNVVRVTVTGGRTKGAPASVKITPPLGIIHINNNARSSAPSILRYRRVKVGKGKRARYRRVRYRTHSVSTIRAISRGSSTDQDQTVTITGLIPARTSRTYSFAIKNVPLAMSALLRWRLVQNGINVEGSAKTGIFPSNVKAETLGMKEEKLLEIMANMNKPSDNYLAESLFRKLSTIVTVAETDPSERSRTLMKSFLEVCNVDGKMCTFIDGSGLSHSNRTSANTVIDLLTAIRQNGMFNSFVPTLSIAGVDGTLRNRMKNTAAQYNVHGKTGTLNGVTAVSGYVVTQDQQLAAFFVTMQRFSGSSYTYKRIQDQIMEAIADFSYRGFGQSVNGDGGR